MFATTTKQLIDQSRCFRILFWSSIFFFCIGIMLMATFPFTSCAKPSNYSCSWYFSSGSYYYECTNYGVKYCCTSGYGYCGSNFCAEKPMLYRPCDAVIIAGGSLMGVGGFLAIFVFVMFFHFRSQIRKGGYLGGQFIPSLGVYNPGPQLYNPPQVYNPVIIYSDQPQPQQYSQPQSQGQVNGAPFQGVNQSEAS